MIPAHWIRTKDSMGRTTVAYRSLDRHLARIRFTGTTHLVWLAEENSPLYRYPTLEAAMDAVEAYFGEDKRRRQLESVIAAYLATPRTPRKETSHELRTSERRVGQHQ